VTFKWFFNASEGATPEGLPSDRHSDDGLVSTLDFAARAGGADYGALFCAGANVVGSQVVPCKFQIVPTGA